MVGALRCLFRFAVDDGLIQERNNPAFGVTATYVRADLYEVAIALAALTGEAHPLV